MGRRIEKNEGGTITRYVYDNANILETFNGSNVLQQRFTHRLDVDQPISFDQGGQSYFYLADALGSIMKITDSSGTVQQTYLYDSFGNIVQQTGTINQPFTYTGREWDAAAGLYFYRARYYDATIGRFINEDPIMFAGGINFYIYVSNNPIRFLDPFGLDCWDDFVACKNRAFNNFGTCLTGVGLFFTACVGICLSLCPFTPAPPLCLAVCLDSCIGMAGIATIACASYYAYQYGLCLSDYFACKIRNRRRRC